MKLNTMRLILFFLNSYLNIYKLTSVYDHLKYFIFVFNDFVIIQIHLDLNNNSFIFSKENEKIS